jgi:zinc transporter 1
VISLLVGLWAVKVANQRTNSKQYTYGWQRAETLGALVNGVFLVALCLSIFLEAIQRFVEPQEVSHPKLILIVGSLGLASNIIGLFLFHDHGHSHGGHSHGHDAHSEAEEGHAHDHGIDAHDHAVADEGGNIADVLPQNRIAFPSALTQTPQSDRRRSSLSGKKAKRHNRSQSRNYSTLDEIYVQEQYHRILQAA